MDPRLELRHLRYFVAVAEELHFGRAAARLHLAQPPLSQQIRKLEEIVGYRLFHRTSRAVELTSVGQVFLERARRALQTVNEDLEEARSVGRGEVGFLRVGMVGTCMLTGVPRLLQQYRRDYPKVNLQLQESYTAGVIDGLRKGKLDAGFLRDGGECEGLVVRLLTSEPFLAIVPRSHRLARRRSVAAGELRDEPFVFFPPEAGIHPYEKSMAVCEASGFRPHIVQVAPHWLTILRLVGAGMGVTLAPACVREIASADVVCLPLKAALSTSDIELACRAGEERAIVLSFAAAMLGQA